MAEHNIHSSDFSNKVTVRNDYERKSKIEGVLSCENLATPTEVGTSGSDQGLPSCGRIGKQISVQGSSIKSFSGIGISQILDQECPSLFPHFRLLESMHVFLFSTKSTKAS